MVSRKHKTSIILPSAYRPHKLDNALTTMGATLDGEDVEVLVSCIEDDAESIQIVRNHHFVDRLWLRTREEYEFGSIWAFNELTRRSSGDVIAEVDDDQIFHPGWLRHALRELDRLGGGLVAFNDLKSDGNEYAAHFIVSRDFLIQYMGGVMWPPMYKAWWCDREMSEIAKAVGKYAWAQDAVVEHNHWSFGLSGVDETYRAGKTHHDSDFAIWQQRRAEHYPITWEPII
jgi:hypothetical protein